MICVTIIIGLVTALFGYIYYIQRFSRFGKLINQFPGPDYLPILGNMAEFHDSTANIFKMFHKYGAKYKESYRLWIMFKPIVFIVTPEDAEIILTHNTHIKKSLIYEFLHDWLGTGLLTATGKKWQYRRKLLTPSFHFNILRKFTVTFGEHSQQLIEDLKKECLNQQTSIVPYISHATLQVICETAMGTSLDTTNEVHQGYFQSIYDKADIMIYRISSPWLSNNIIFQNLSRVGWKNKKITTLLHKFTTSVIKEREKNFKDSDLDYLDNDDEEATRKKKKLAMLDLLISTKKNIGTIDDEGIREEVDTFMFEGHDTTSAGISYALLLLANHKEHQEKIVQELKEIFGDSKRPAAYEDLQQMQYLELCLKESLRLFPSVPLIGRMLENDLQLTNFLVPAGAGLNICIYDIHRDARHYPNPNKFDPERFLPDNSKHRHPFAYIPFSAGPRNCIGQKFAMLEMKSMISAVLRNYILDPVDTPETVTMKLDFVLRNECDILIKFRPRI